MMQIQLTNSHCTDVPPDAADKPARRRATRAIRETVLRSPRWRRGTAEIELLFCCMLLITLLFLVKGAMRIGALRLSTTSSTSFKAFHDAISANPPAYAGNDPAPLDGFESIRPGFPKRMHNTHDTALVVGKTVNDETFAANIGYKAAVISPAWTFSGYPVPGDQNYNNAWLADYVDESHANLNSPLGLAPAWPP